MGSSAAGRRALARVNPRGSIPTFMIGGRLQVGFSPSSLTRAIRRARSAR